MPDQGVAIGSGVGLRRYLEASFVASKYGGCQDGHTKCETDTIPSTNVPDCFAGHIQAQIVRRYTLSNRAATNRGTPKKSLNLSGLL